MVGEKDHLTLAYTLDKLRFVEDKTFKKRIKTQKINSGNGKDFAKDFGVYVNKWL